MRRPSPRSRRVALQVAPLVVVAVLVAVAASNSGGAGDPPAQPRDRLSGSIAIDGAAALREPTEIAADRFRSRHPDVRVTVGASGDENAIATFCAGEIDVAAVARRLAPSERRPCRSAGVSHRPIELAREGIVLVVSKRNTFVRCLSLAQVRRIWRPAAPAESWSQAGNTFPALDLEPVGWKPDTPPYTLLAQALFARSDPRTRNDYELAADADALLRTVAASRDAIGYLPLGELKAGSGVRAISIDGGRGCVKPSNTTVRAGTYPALARPLYLYVSASSLRRLEVRRFVRDYANGAPAISAAVGIVPTASHRVYRKFTRL